ncbi:MAG: choice-of-anchor tandem repeat GloVer-containing protein, partial [Verrucomicrobiota bacterium]
MTHMNLQRILYPLRTLASAAIAALTLALTPAKAHAAPPTPPAPAASNAPVTMSNIFSFTNQQSLASLVQGTNGNFYGTTATGGTNSDGAVFMLSPAGAFTNLVSFAGTNGATPLAPLFLAKDGNFYGTTSSGGVGNDGTIFSLSPSGAFTNRFKFTGSNGAAPNGGLAQGSNGLFYGTTSAGGSNKLGEVFSWSLSRGVSNLHSFTGTDGSSPLAGVVVATNGYLYGTTSSGGANGLGTVFELVPTNKNKLTTLVSFALDQGAAPLGLVPAPGGNFYGVTSQGGSNGIGTVFKVTTSGRLTVLASFAISNGSNPKAPLLLGSDGFLYGTTEQGGTNGKGTLFRLSTNGGALSTLVTFQGANGAYPQAGLLQASDGNIYGTTSGGGANSSGIVFELSGFAPTISQQPTNQGFTAEKSINFFVQAAGSQPLFYQWLFDGVSLTNTNNLSGATTNHLTISTASLTNSGSYSVIVSNAYGAVTSSVAKLTLPAPTLTIKPRPPATVTNAGLTVQGTATGKYGVTNVFYQVLNQTNSGTNWTTVTTNGWTNAPTNLDWSVTVTLQGGSNIFEAYSVDPVGDPSPTNSVKVFYLTRSLLTLMTTGDGTISPRVSDTNLVVDRAFTVRARPGPDNLFSNWTGTNLTGTNVTGTFTNTSNPWTFLMSSNNMYLTANFVTNPFLQFHAAGTYDGLFSVSNTAAPSSGIIKNLRVGTLGTYTGRLYIGGSNYSLSGAFDVAGNATEQIAKTTAGTLTLAMNLNWTNIPPQITGTVAGKSGSSWTASLLAELAGTNLASAAYTMLLPPGTNSAVASPPGFGYATITNHAGSLTLKGALADAAAFSETVAETASSNLLIYAAPYSGDGLLLGRLTLTNGPPEGSLTWIKPASSTGLFTNGYTNVVTVESSLWTSPQAKTPALPLPNAQLLVSNAGLLLSFHAAVTDSNALAKLGRIPTNSLSGSINPKNGRLTLSFGNTNGRAAIAGAGAVLQNQTNARGYFVSKTNYGSILLQNEPQGIAPVIYQQPAAEKFTNNATVHFSVGAAGSEPLEYQWVMDGSILTNGGDISGATNNLLAIAGESLATSGSYSVIVSNAYGAVTSSVANLTLPAPTLTIKPRPPATVTSAALTVQGTAAGKYGVTNVFFQVLNQAGPGTNWTPVTTNGWTGAPASVDWSANVTLRGGSNIFEAYSVDPVGNPSLTSRVNVFYLTHSLLTLTTIGDGTIGPRDLGSNLVVGRPYTISAAPAKNNLFSNWT